MGIQQSLMSPWKGSTKKKEKEKKLLQHRVPLFVFGHPTEQA